MMKETMQRAFNEQVKLEMESSYLYLAMAAYFHDNGMDGMAQWMKVQSGEEMGHAMKFFGHLVDRNVRVELAGLEQPKKDWASPLEAFEDAYRHELFITTKIHSLVKQANEEQDYAAGAMLQWFVSEQVEEEAATLKVVETLKKIGGSGSGLVMLDRQLGKRA